MLARKNIVYVTGNSKEKIMKLKRLKWYLNVCHAHHKTEVLKCNINNVNYFLTRHYSMIKNANKTMSI